MAYESAVGLKDSVVYSPAAQSSVNSVTEKRNRKSVIKKEPMLSGMITAPPFGGSHPAPKWED